jgi:hypothetical protein
MAGKLLMQHGQVFGQPARYRGFFGMHAFYFGGLQDQLRQLFTVTVMIAHDDVVDDLRQRCGTPVFVDRLLSQLCQLALNNFNVQLLTGSGTRQRLLTAAAVIHIIFTEQRRCARDRERKLT